MPRAVRNFWLDLVVEGRGSNIETGPRARDGGFSELIYIRSEGDVRLAGRSVGFSNGQVNTVTWYPERGEPIELSRAAR